MARPRTEVTFSTNVDNMNDWAGRTRIPLPPSAATLDATYARAHHWLKTLKLILIREHKWSDARTTDNRLLFSLETSSIWRSSSGLPAGPPLRLELPLHCGSFFSPDRRMQWQMVFHSDTFDSVRKICPPVNDILNLIQCLVTGLVTISFEERLPGGIHRTTRGLPPAQWIMQNKRELCDIFGSDHYRALVRASGDTKSSFKLEIVPH